MFSIIVPVFNRLKIIKKAIPSLIVEEMDNLDILDDGSEQDIANFLDSLADNDSRVKIHHLKHIGWPKIYYKCLELLETKETKYIFMCESDMRLAKGWAEWIDKAFMLSPETVCISPHYHYNNSRGRRRCEEFRVRCLTGKYGPPGAKGFGSAYKKFPSGEKPILIANNIMLKYVSSIVCTYIMKKEHFQKIDLEKIKQYPYQEDAWISWWCFKSNNWNSKSLACPGRSFALDGSGGGLHGNLPRAVNWVGENSFWLYLLNYCRKISIFLKRRINV